MEKTLVLFILLSTFLSPNLFIPTSSDLGYSATAGMSIKCATCGRTIRGKYLKANGKYYCSQRCYEKSLPKCSKCGKPAKYHSSGKYYCSKRCMEQSWPICAFCHRHSPTGIRRGYKKIFICSRCAKLPKCFACFMPAEYKLPDGRSICANCRKTAIMHYDTLVRVAEDVRKTMRERLGLSTNHKIIYKMVGRDGLSGKNTNGQPGSELGLYKFEQTIETYTLTKTDYLGRKTTTEQRREKPASHTIYLLYGLPKDKLIEVAAHELAHDWMQEHLPKITDLTLKEGWAEYAASLVNNLYGHSRRNMRMKLNKNPVYGGGFRRLYKLSRKGGLKAVVKYLERENSNAN